KLTHILKHSRSKMNRQLGRSLAVIFAAILASCSGHGPGNGVVPVPASSAASSKSLVGATFAFKIPLPAKSSSARRKPQYLPASVRSISLTLNTVNGGAPPTGLTLAPVSVSPTSPGCAADPSSSGDFICTETFQIPPGTDALTIQAFDGANGTGNL